MHRSSAARVASPLAAALVLLGIVTSTLGTSPAAAAPADLTVTTPYPMVETQAGATVKLSLQVASPVAEPVELQVGGLPDEWRATLRGGGFVIHALTTSPDAPATADLEIALPADVASGDYPLTITGSAPDGSRAAATVTLEVVEQVDAGVQVTADFPSITGAPDSAFTYNLTIVNNTPEDGTFTFDPSGPQGWTVEASPSAQANAQTVTIEAGSSTGVKVTATPPETAAEGSYPIEVAVTAATGATGAISLDAEVTGTPKLTLTTADQRLDVTGQAGDDHRIPLIVANEGTAALDSVKLAGTAPSGWDVTFEPAETGPIAAGETVQATAIVTPSTDAVAGDYAMTIRSSAGSQSSSIDVRYAVTGSRLLGLVAVAVIAAAFAGLTAVYVRFGRR